MSDFPSLEPAMTILPMTGGSIKTEPSFSPSIDAVFQGVGADYIHGDADMTHVRLKAHSVAKDKSGGLIYLNYTGVINVTPETGLAISGASDAKTTSFGSVFMQPVFETGDDKFKELETSTFVASGRFLVSAGKPTTVEYKVSKVVKGQ